MLFFEFLKQIHLNWNIRIRLDTWCNIISVIKFGLVFIKLYFIRCVIFTFSPFIYHVLYLVFTYGYNFTTGLVISIEYKWYLANIGKLVTFLCVLS